MDKHKIDNMVGSSEKMIKVFDLVSKIASADSTALILGESGTGKELVARAIHEKSKRARLPFVPVNCGAIPEELLESELFGHEKGAFTGAFRMHTGRFEIAAGGSIFLDEISEMSPNLQVKLLRVLQEKEFERVGAINTIRTDVRIIAATNKNLEEEVEKGRFREDLYYRLNVIPIHIPPLRERSDDIPSLVKYFIDKNAKERSMEVLEINKQVMQLLMNYRWPGNVRELENLIERLSVLSDGNPVVTADLPEKRMQFLYKEEGKYCFMDNESYEQVFLSEDQVGEAKNFLLDNIEAEILLFEDRPLGISLPNFIDVIVTKADPWAKGDSVSGNTKPVTVQNLDNQDKELQLFLNENKHY